MPVRSLLGVNGAADGIGNRKNMRGDSFVDVCAGGGRIIDSDSSAIRSKGKVRRRQGGLMMDSCGVWVDDGCRISVRREDPAL
jgi:hypothetical protein